MFGGKGFAAIEQDVGALRVHQLRLQNPVKSRVLAAKAFSNAECPKDKRNEISGWAKDVSDKYGSPSDLKLKAKYLSATL